MQGWLKYLGQGFICKGDELLNFLGLDILKKGKESDVSVWVMLVGVVCECGYCLFEWLNVVGEEESFEIVRVGKALYRFNVKVFKQEVGN